MLFRAMGEVAEVCKQTSFVYLNETVDKKQNFSDTYVKMQKILLPLTVSEDAEIIQQKLLFVL